MAWPPVYTPPVPQAVDQGYPPEWGPQPMSVDATLPAPTPVDAWPPQFPEQALSDATAAPLAANPPMGATTAPPSGAAPSPAEQAVEPPAPLGPEHGAPDTPYPPQASDNQPDVVSGGGIEHANKNGGNFAQPNSPYEEALARKYGIQSQAEQAQAQGDQRNVDEYARNLALNQLKDARDNELKAQALAKVQAASAKVDAMQVDPNHWWASRSGPQKVGSLIGAAIGGFLAARQQTGHNAFLDGINQAIQEDINVQMANIDNAKAGVNRQQNLYANYLEQLGDAKAARYATAGKMFELGAMKTAAEVSKFKSPMTQADGELARQQLIQASQANYAAAQQEAFKNQLAFDEQARKDAESKAQIGKLHAETSKLYGEAKPGDAVPVVVHGPGGTVSLNLDPKRAAIVNKEQEELDKAADQRREHFKDKENNPGWVRKYNDQLKRARDTLHQMGASDEEVMRVYPDWNEGDAHEKTPSEKEADRAAARAPQGLPASSPEGPPVPGKPLFQQQQEPQTPRLSPEEAKRLGIRGY